jgi:hypothetical protein
MQLCKYDREPLLQAFDSLHTQFPDMKSTTDDFPIRAEPLTRCRRRRQIINMVDESDGEVGDMESGDDGDDRSNESHLREHRGLNSTQLRSTAAQSSC